MKTIQQNSQTIPRKTEPKSKKRISAVIPFGAVMLLLLAGLVNFESELAGFPPFLLVLTQRASIFTTIFLGIFIEAAPFLLLGTLASGLVEVFVSNKDLARWIPHRTFPAAVAGGFLGLFFPICECGVVPFSRRLINKGLPLPAAVALMLAAPVVNPVVIASTLAAFGPGLIFWGRIVVSLLVAVTVGALFGFAEPKAVLHPDVHCSTPVLSGPDLIQPGWRHRVGRVLTITADEFFDMGRFLVFGALLAALMQVMIPQSDLVNLGQGPLLSVVVMILLAVLLSVCSTVDAFIALAFVNVFSAGSILGFLVYGPMVDIKSTMMYLQVFKKRPVVYLVVLPLLLVLLIGFAVNLLWK